MAAQAHEREEAVRLSVFRFAIGKARQPSKPPPRRNMSPLPPGASSVKLNAYDLPRKSPIETAL